MKPLFEQLGLPTLIFTDLDSVEKESATKVRPERDMEYRTGNTTLKKWVPKLVQLDDLLDLADEKKQIEDQHIRVAYQCPVLVKFEADEGEVETIPYTFEDSLALTNVELFRAFNDPKGLLKKMQTAFERETINDACDEMFQNLGKGE